MSVISIRMKTLFHLLNYCQSEVVYAKTSKIMPSLNAASVIHFCFVAESSSCFLRQWSLCFFKMKSPKLHLANLLWSENKDNCFLFGVLNQVYWIICWQLHTISSFLSLFVSWKTIQTLFCIKRNVLYDVNLKYHHQRTQLNLLTEPFTCINAKWLIRLAHISLAKFSHFL